MTFETVLSVAMLGGIIWVVRDLLPRAVKDRDAFALTCAVLTALLAPSRDVAYWRTITNWQCGPSWAYVPVIARISSSVVPFRYPSEARPGPMTNQ